MNKIQKIKLARLLKFVKELTSDKGLIVLDGEIEVGTEVFVYDEAGEPVPAPDGVYTTDDIQITLEGGKISAVEEKKNEEETIIVEETPTTETVEIAAETDETNDEPAEDVDMLKARITELEVDVANRDAIISELQKELEEYRKKEETPEGEPAEEATEIELSSTERKQRAALDIVSFCKR